MKTIAIVIVLLSSAPARAEEKKKDDAKRIQGKWKLVERHYDGNVSKGGHTLEIGADTIIYKLAQRKITLEYKLDAGKTPAQMDWTGERGGRKRTKRMIYQLKGDTLKTCWKRPAGKRPTKFEANKGDGQVIHVYKRVNAD